MMRALDRLDLFLHDLWEKKMSALSGALLTGAMMAGCFAFLTLFPLPHAAQGWQRPATAALMAALLGLMLLPVMRRAKGRVGFGAALLCAVCVAALFGVRVAFLGMESPDYQDYLHQWTLAMRQKSFSEVMRGTVGDYTVIYQYLVFLISRAGLPDIYLYKGFTLAFEVLLASSAASLFCHARGEGWGIRGFLVYAAVLALPTVVLNGSAWGQCDAVYTALALAGLYACLRGKPFLCAACLALSLCFKLQAVFLLPIVAALWHGRKLRVAHLLSMLGVFFLVALPAVCFGKPLKNVLAVYLVQAREYKNLVLGAPTVYQLVNVFGRTDAAYAAAGILTALAAVALILLPVMRGRRAENPALLLDAAFALVLVVPFLLPHMHERYFFMADILSVVYAALHPRRAFAPILVQLGSLSGYVKYLYQDVIVSARAMAILMLALSALSVALLARDSLKGENAEIKA